MATRPALCGGGELDSLRPVCRAAVILKPLHSCQTTAGGSVGKKSHRRSHCHEDCVCALTGVLRVTVRPSYHDDAPTGATLCHRCATAPRCVITDRSQPKTGPKQAQSIQKPVNTDQHPPNLGQNRPRSGQSKAKFTAKIAHPAASKALRSTDLPPDRRSPSTPSDTIKHTKVYFSTKTHHV